MKKYFTSNSSYKVIRITDDEKIKLTFNTIYSWEKKEFDIINVPDDNIIDIILENNEVDAIVVQGDIGINNLLNLPEYYKRRIYRYDKHKDYGIDLALKISKSQLNGDCNPMFSIITPLYNTKIEYFKYAYQSLCEQTLNDWEWILIDDSPEPLYYIKKFISEQKDVRLKYYRIAPTKGNIGLSKWRGNCMSTGKWLIEFDHDDMLYYWTLSTIKDAIQAFPKNKFIYSDNTTIDKDNNITNCLYGKDFDWCFGYGHSYTTIGPKGEKIRTDSAGPINNCNIRHIVGVPNHFRCWERNFYFSIGGHNQEMRIADDYELLVRSFLRTKFTHINCCCYAQRFDGNNSQFKKDLESEQGNIADIQRRVRLTSIFYNDAIHSRLEKVGLDDSKWIREDPYSTALVYKKIHPREYYEDSFIPKWMR